MNDPLLLLFLGLVIGIACIVYWRVLLAILAVASLAVFVVGLVTTGQALNQFFG